VVAEAVNPAQFESVRRMVYNPLGKNVVEKLCCSGTKSRSVSFFEEIALDSVKSVEDGLTISSHKIDVKGLPADPVDSDASISRSEQAGKTWARNSQDFRIRAMLKTYY
jgi:hypothetical protein